MVASYAKHGLTLPNSPNALQPNNLLYLSLSPYFTERQFLNFLNEFTGFESCKFFPTFALAKFDTTQHASNALDLIHNQTNFTVNYSKPKSNSCQNDGNSIRIFYLTFKILTHSPLTLAMQAFSSLNLKRQYMSQT